MIFRKILIALFCFLLSMPAQATEVIPDGYLGDSARTEGEFRAAIDDFLAIVKEIPGGTVRGTATIDAGTMTIPDNTAIVVVSAESGSADDLDTATQTGSPRDGRIVWYRAATGHVITIPHLAGGTGQFYNKSAASVVISETVYAAYYYNESSSRWEELQTASAGIGFGGDGTRQCPTTGTISGEYNHLGNWTTTGDIDMAPGTIVKVLGNMTVATGHTITVGYGAGGGRGAPAVTGGKGIPSAGAGFAPGSAFDDAKGAKFGGGGGGNGGAGGDGGSSETDALCPGGPAYSISSSFCGSGGGGGCSTSALAAGGNGGKGGGGAYFEVLGNIVINGDIVIDGEDGGDATAANYGGGGGGGSGGSGDFRSRGGTGISGTGHVYARGGAGGAGNDVGAADGGAGGGGGGGNLRAEASETITGVTWTATGGAAGTGASTEPGVAGANATPNLIQNSTPSARPF